MKMTVQSVKIRMLLGMKSKLGISGEYILLVYYLCHLKIIPIF